MPNEKALLGKGDATEVLAGLGRFLSFIFGRPGVIVRSHKIELDAVPQPDRSKSMNRRNVLRALPATGLAAVFPASAHASALVQPPDQEASKPLHSSATENIPVAFLLSDAAVVIDFAGPWEVFQDVVIPARSNSNPFRLYTVAETTAPIRASAGLTIVPNFTLATAPLPKILVIPAQAPPTTAVIDWVRQAARAADMTMSVCTGAFLLAKAGLLDGKSATTHHGAYAELAMDFPDVVVRRGARFVDTGAVASSGGLTSGIDLALHIVERYFGRSVAAATANTMEYQGSGWMKADSNSAFLTRRLSTPGHPICAVCEMDVDTRTAPSAVYHRETYLFCGEPHKKLFVNHPDRFAVG